MDDINWEILDEVAGNVNAELIRSYLEAYEIPVVLSQEGAGHSVFPVNVGRFGRVQILVPSEYLEQAQQLLEIYQSGSPNTNEEDAGPPEQDDVM